jgi:hypothetical protein
MAIDPFRDRELGNGSRQASRRSKNRFPSLTRSIWGSQ